MAENDEKLDPMTELSIKFAKLEEQNKQLSDTIQQQNEQIKKMLDSNMKLFAAANQTHQQESAAHPAKTKQDAYEKGREEIVKCILH